MVVRWFGGDKALFVSGVDDGGGWCGMMSVRGGSSEAIRLLKRYIIKL